MSARLPLSPYLTAAAVYDREPCARTFEEDLFLHLTLGHVVSTPTLFAMFRPVHRDWPLHRLRNPMDSDPAGDCWWIWLAAGDLAQLFAFPASPKKWVAFERANSPRFWSYDRLRRLFLSISTAPAARAGRAVSLP